MQAFDRKTLLNSAKVFTNVIEDFRKGGYKELIHPELFRVYSEHYHKAVSMFANAKHGSTEFEMHQRFKLNLSRMAAYKSYHVTRQLRSIKTKDVDVDTFDKKAKGVIKKYNRYQAVEYNTAVARARTAEQFAVFQKEADVFPNIEWIASRSSVKRDAHVRITGTILPQNHPFWNENQPGNLWNCKCGWRTTNKPVTADPGNIATAAQGLEGNPAFTGKIFTNEHPYISSARKTKDIEAFLTKNIRDTAVTDALNALRKKTAKNSVMEAGKTEAIKIGFARKGIEHVASDSHDYHNFKNMLLPYFNTVLSNAEYVASSLSDKANPMVKSYHYFKIIIIDKPAFINVREMIDGTYVMHALTTKIKS